MVSLADVATRAAKVCPACGRGYVDESHVSGKRYGVCRACYAKALELRYEEGLRAKGAVNAYNAARMAACRAVRRGHA